jgi:hypothetical protein
MVQCAHPSPSQFRAPSRAPRFEIHAARCPQVLPRILGVFARLDLLPIDLRARQSCGGLWVRFAVELDAARAERAAEKLRAIVGVEAVVLIHAPPANRPAEPRPAARVVTARRVRAPVQAEMARM